MEARLILHPVWISLPHFYSTALYTIIYVWACILSIWRNLNKDRLAFHVMWTKATINIMFCQFCLKEDGRFERGSLLVSLWKQPGKAFIVNHFVLMEIASSTVSCITTKIENGNLLDRKSGCGRKRSKVSKKKRKTLGHSWPNTDKIGWGILNIS